MIIITLHYWHMVQQYQIHYYTIILGMIHNSDHNFSLLLNIYILTAIKVSYYVLLPFILR
jgi:hypothetical protein